MRFQKLSAGLGALLAIVSGLTLSAAPAVAQPPPQRLASAVLIYPLIVVEGGGAIRDTRVEIVNMTGTDQRLSCFYVDDRCNEIGFQVLLTPNQPLSWLASRGSFGSQSRLSVPGFHQTGELKCAVVPEGEVAADDFNAVQGRAIVIGADGETQGFGAIGFRRLADGSFSGDIPLDGETYDQCPAQLDFAFLAAQPGSASEIILAPCSEDLLNQRPMSTVVQLRVWNEFEESLSGSFTVTCLSRRLLTDASPIFRLSQLGTPTGHLAVQAVQIPVVGLLIDRFTDGAVSSSANEPFLQGGRSATLTFPYFR